MRPPIAAPEVSTVAPPPPRLVFERSIEISFRPTLIAALRCSIKQLLTLPFLVLGDLFLVTLFTAIALPPMMRTYGPFSLWLIFFCSINAPILVMITMAIPLSWYFHQRKTLILTPDFLVRREKRGDIFISWRQVVLVFRWSGDLLSPTFMDGAYIPRNAFATREEAEELFEILSALRRSRGAAWKEEWNGKTFGTAIG